VPARGHGGTRWWEQNWGGVLWRSLFPGGEQLNLSPARRPWWRMRAGRGGRQASLCKHVVLVVEKEFVIHLQTRCPKTDIGVMIDGGRFQTEDPYRRIGARRERARERQM